MTAESVRSLELHLARCQMSALYITGKLASSQLPPPYVSTRHDTCAPTSLYADAHTRGPSPVSPRAPPVRMLAVPRRGGCWRVSFWSAALMSAQRRARRAAPPHRPQSWTAPSSCTTTRTRTSAAFTSSCPRARMTPPRKRRQPGRGHDVAKKRRRQELSLLEVALSVDRLPHVLVRVEACRRQAYV